MDYDSSAQWETMHVSSDEFQPGYKEVFSPLEDREAVAQVAWKCLSSFPEVLYFNQTET